MPAAPATLAELLLQRAAAKPDARAVLFLSDAGTGEAGLTYGELAQQARALACRLAARSTRGDRAVLMLPTGLDFVIGLFGCALAGLVAVPMMPPRRLATRDFSRRIVADCAPRLLLTSSAMAQGMIPARLAQAGMDCILLDAPDGDAAEPRLPAADDLAVLQYTSGSTSAPKGVMVSHANLLANLEAIRLATGGCGHSTFVNWSPLFHDLGLVMDLLQPLYLGGRAVLMRPAAFVQRPLHWLKAIHGLGAEMAGGPNFAFDLCVDRFRPEQMEGVDLSCWKVAFCGAEPVRAGTLARFASTFAPYGFDARAFYPAYGLAEATLLVTAGRRGAGATVCTVSARALQAGRAEPPADVADAREQVACGLPVAGTRIAIVDPVTRAPLPPQAIGEIWISGPGVAQGYWRNETATLHGFRVRIVGEEAEWLRTGDLGYLDDRGALVVTGRIKDLMIVRGVNHYPQDVEETVARAHPALLGGASAAFTAPAGERIIVVAEVERSSRRSLPHAEIVDAVREAVARDHELSVQDVGLLRPGGLPKTTSGKVQRRRIAELWAGGGLDVLQP